MSHILETFLEIQNDVFAPFDEVCLFGSSLWTDTPNDIDVLLVYDQGSPHQIAVARHVVARRLEEIFSDHLINFTTLSRSELLQTQFLYNVAHLQIKG